MPRRRPEWTRKPHKPLPVRDEPQHKEGTKSPKRVFIERKDGSVEIIKEAKMTKQEEIREGVYYVPQSNRPDIQEGIAKWLYGASTNPWKEPVWNDIPEWRREQCRKNAYFLMVKLNAQGAVLKVERELPEKLTNNIGCMSKSEIEAFADKVLKECGYPHQMEWTTAGDTLIGETIYIDESHINEYPYMAKERVLHEIAHIDTHSQDDRHGELFHRRYAELVNRFLAGYVAVEPLIKEG